VRCKHLTHAWQINRRRQALGTGDGLMPGAIEHIGLSSGKAFFAVLSCRAKRIAQ
jgi:hypothetical protein